MFSLRMSTGTGIAIASLTAWLVLPSLAVADTPSWPQFHGPNRDNISQETGLLREWPQEGPKLLWTAHGIGHGFAGVTIADGLIYTVGNIDEDTVITALDVTGTKLWQVTNGKGWYKSVAGSRGVPTIDGPRLYHESPNGEVSCLDAKTGKSIWSLNILERFQSPNNTWALAESLLIDGDRVICRPGGPEASVVALDKSSGRLVWAAESTGDLAGYGSPILVEHQGMRMILTMTAKSLIGVNADTGKLLFRFEHLTPFDENIFTPIFRDGRVFISTRTTGSVLLEINVDGEAASVKPVWTSTDLDNQHGGMVLLDGYLYGSSHVNNNGRWVCLDWKTGRTMYIEDGVGQRGSVAYADGMLYTMDERGTVALVRPSPNSHEIVSHFNIPQGGQGKTWAHPVILDGRLYIRHGNFLYAFCLLTQREKDLPRG